MNLFSNIPMELKQHPQWCISGKNKIPYFVNNQGKLHRAKVNDSTTWMCFEKALHYAIHYNMDIGFVLSKSDGYCCIDLDVVDEEAQRAKGKPVDPTLWTTPEELERYRNIVTSFSTYTELSRSGKGVHIWVKGKIGTGCRRDGVEIYSQKRYIICTGRVFINKPIEHRQELLEQLVQEIRKHQKQEAKESFELVEHPPVTDDNTIWRRASNAKNGDKFKALCYGSWQQLGYKSQSEADYALMSMLAFYSPSNEQCRRMFRQTQLGKRPKATRNDKYLNRTLRPIRQHSSESIAHGKQIAEVFLREYAQKRASAQQQNNNRKGSNNE